jgi:Zn-dependent peptidase ImmA (M78 family)
VPTDGLVSAFADSLGFDASFFFGPSLIEFREDECFWRKQTTPASIRARVLAHGTLFGHLVDYLDAVLVLPRPNVPNVGSVTEVEDIERAAERCRMQWGLGLDVPVLNIVRAAEHAGVVVTRFDGHAHKIDAFSRPNQRRSVIVLNNDKNNAARSNFDLCHECGHLVMHGAVGPGAPESEAQADRFASALLMPRTGFIRAFPRSPKGTWTKPYWDALFRMKADWSVNVAAIVRRAFDLSLIDAASYHRAYKYMSAKGWMKSGEPLAVDYHEPEIVPRCLEKLNLHFSMDHEDLARALGFTVETLAQVSGVAFEQKPEAREPRGTVIPLGPRLAQVRRGEQIGLPMNDTVTREPE